MLITIFKNILSIYINSFVSGPRTFSLLISNRVHLSSVYWYLVMFKITQVKRYTFYLI